MGRISIEDQCVMVSEALFSFDIKRLSDPELSYVLSGVPYAWGAVGDSMLDLMVSGFEDSCLVGPVSKNECRKKIQDGAVRLNGKKMTDIGRKIVDDDIVPERLMVLKMGKNCMLIRQVEVER